MAHSSQTASSTTPIRRAHNPEVAGSNPAPATTKALLSGAFCLQAGRDGADFVPLFVPIAKVRHGETLGFPCLAVVDAGDSMPAHQSPLRVALVTA